MNKLSTGMGGGAAKAYLGFEPGFRGRSVLELASMVKANVVATRGVTLVLTTRTPAGGSTKTSPTEAAEAEAEAEAWSWGAVRGRAIPRASAFAREIPADE